MKCPRCNSDRVNVTKRNEKVSHFGATLNNELVAICQECGKSFDPELAYLKQKTAEAKQNLSDICNQKLKKILAVEELDFTVANFPYGFFAAPDIPDKKLFNAISTYASSVQKNEILFLVDLSIFGSAKAGVVITPQKLYYKNLGNSYAIELNTIRLCDIKRSKLLINELTLELNSGATAKLLMNIIKQLLKQCNNTEDNINTIMSENTMASTESTIVNSGTASASPKTPSLPMVETSNTKIHTQQSKPKSKSMKKWGCGCLSVFVILLIIIGSFAEVEKTSEDQKNKDSSKEQIISAVQSKKHTTLETKASNTKLSEKNMAETQSDAEKTQSEVDRYYAEATKMRSLAQAIKLKKKVLSEKELADLKRRVLKDHFEFHEDNPKKIITSQEEYCAETRKRVTNLLQTYNSLKQKHSRLLKKNGSSYEISQTAKKINLFVDQIKKAQQEIVMQDAILDLKKAAYELLNAVCGPNMETNLEKQRNNKKVSALEFIKKISVSCKMKVASKDGYIGTPQFTFTITNNSNVAIDVVEGNLCLKRRNGEKLITEKEFLILRAENDSVPPRQKRTFSPNTAKIFLLEDGWDKLFVVNDYVLDFEITRVRTVKSMHNDAVEYDISE